MINSLPAITSFCSIRPARLNIDAISGGEGRFITKGKAIDIRWEKDSPWGITHYYDKNEQEIRLNQGTTWVEIVQNDRIDSITYQ